MRVESRDDGISAELTDNDNLANVRKDRVYSITSSGHRQKELMITHGRKINEYDSPAEGDTMIKIRRTDDRSLIQIGATHTVHFRISYLQFWMANSKHRTG
jgi:hypothetical protein